MNALRSTSCLSCVDDLSGATDFDGIRHPNSSTLTFLEFFAGSGLVAEALKGRMTTVWANDICSKKASVYSANHDGRPFHLGSIADVSGKHLPDADMAWASFPCQDLSLAGLTEGIHGARSGLVWEWLRVIDEMRCSPPILVAENVTGLISVDSGKHYVALHQALKQRGYRVGAMLIDAAQWVPQSRPRIFVVAVRKNVRFPLDLTSQEANWLHGGSVEAVGRSLNDFVWWRMPTPPPRSTGLSDIVDWEAPESDELTMAKNISLIPARHRQLLDATPKRRPFVAPGYKRTRAGQQVLELRFDDVAGCLRTPSGGSSRQLLVIKRGDALTSRLLTVRETARLMGAPDDYKLPGSYNDGYKAMGDGVAVPVARWLADHLLVPLARACAKN